jgi:uncharacterized protein YdaU (DUF1376 family)
MSRRPWMPFYPADYLGDTRHLSQSEHGAYLLLLFCYWQNGGLPDDDERLARITVSPSLEHWLKIKPILQVFFENGWKHRRIEAEFAKSEERTRAGRAGGLAKGKQNPSKTPSKTLAPQPQPQYSEADASGAEAPQPVYSDSLHELWGEGIPILESLGVKKPKPIVGRWLRDAKNDAQVVLGAIQRARDARVVDPVPWITRAISTGGEFGKVQRRGSGGSLIEAIDEMRASLAGGQTQAVVLSLPDRQLPRPETVHGAGRNGDGEIRRASGGHRDQPTDGHPAQVQIPPKYRGSG